MGVLWHVKIVPAGKPMLGAVQELSRTQSGFLTSERKREEKNPGGTFLTSSSCRAPTQLQYFV